MTTDLTLPEILTVPEVAELLRMKIESVRELARNGVIPGRRIGKAWRFRRDQILGSFETETEGKQEKERDEDHG